MCREPDNLDRIKICLESYWVFLCLNRAACKIKSNILHKKTAELLRVVD